MLTLTKKTDYAILALSHLASLEEDQVSNVREIATYYEMVFLREAVVRGLEPLPALNDVGALIAENVITEKADREISAWTDSLIARSEIEVVE